MAVCWVILSGRQIYTVIQAVLSLLYIVAKYHFFSAVTWKYIIKYLQTCEGCNHFCEILCISYTKYCDGIIWQYHGTFMHIYHGTQIQVQWYLQYIALYFQMNAKIPEYFSLNYFVWICNICATVTMVKPVLCKITWLHNVSIKILL